MAHLIFLSLLVSLDGFFSGFTFRLKKIRICLPQLLFISLCPLVIVTAVMLSSQRMTAGIPAGAAKGLGFVLFFCLAYLSFADALKKRKSSPPTLITMINNPASSDLDHNQRLSSREALLLGLALSLDNAVLGKLNEVRIIHGKGTGAVRKAVREHLKRSRYVKSFRPGRYGEGEDGVTVAELR